MKLLLLLSFFLIFNSNARSQTAEEMLKQLQDKFDIIDNFTADYSGIVKSKKRKIAAKFKGKVYYKKHKKIKIITNRRIIISDGMSLWTIDKKLKRVVISNSQDNPSPVSIETYLYDYAKFCTIKKLKIETKGTYGIRLIPNSPKIKFKYVDLWFISNHFVNRLELHNNNSIYTVELSKVKINTELKNSEFVFNAEEGVKIVDLR